MYYKFIHICYNFYKNILFCFLFLFLFFVFYLIVISIMENIYLLRYGIIGTKKIINNIMNPESEKELLDPLSSLIRIGLLIFKEKNTKISISHNKIYFQPPNLMQGPVRWTCGDSRDDLHNLCHTIGMALLWYDPNKNKNIENIFNIAIKGLKKLRDSYLIKNAKMSDSNLVCHSILHYITLIENSFVISNHKVSDQKVNEEFINDEYKKIHNLWKDDEIEIINNLFLLAIDKRQKDEEYSYAIKAIESILQEKDILLKKILSKDND